MPGLEVVVNVGEPVELPPMGEPPPADDAPPASSGGEAGELDEPAAPPFPPEWAVNVAVKAVFSYAASARGEHWKLDDDEALAIATPLAIELAQLAETMGVAALPGSGFLNENRMALLTALAAAIVPRYMQDRRGGAAATPGGSTPEGAATEHVIREDWPAEVTHPNGTGSMADQLAQRDGEGGLS